MTDGDPARADRVHFSPRLEALRGLAALMVACFHVTQAPWKHEQALVGAGYYPNAFWEACSKLLFVLCNGLGAVNLFFVLSGFVLAGSLARGPAAAGAAARRFLAARVCRLYPAVWAAVAAYALLFSLVPAGLALNPGEITPLRVGLNMLLLDRSLNGVMWSLQLEMLAVPLILLGALLSRSWGAAPLVALTAVLIALSFTGRWTQGFGNVGLDPLFCFTLGMLLRHGRDVFERVPPGQLALLGALGLMLFFLPRALLGRSTGDFRWINLLEAAGAAVLIATVAYRVHAPPLRLLDRPWMRFYGRISYSFYLLHPLTLTVIWAMPATMEAALRAGVPAPLLILALALASVLAVTPLAWLCWRYVELPGVAAGTWLNRRAR